MKHVGRDCKFYTGTSFMYLSMTCIEKLKLLGKYSCMQNCIWILHLTNYFTCLLVSTIFQSYHDGGCLLVFYVLPTLMHHDADTTHKYTTTSHFTDIVPNSPDFILSLLSEETISIYFNAFGAAGGSNQRPGYGVNDLKVGSQSLCILVMIIV